MLGVQGHVGVVVVVCGDHGGQAIGRVLLVQRYQQGAGRQRQARTGRGLRQDPGDAAVGHHVVEAVARVVRVQRHVGGASLEHSQQRHDQVDGAVQRHAHLGFGAHAQRDQAVREAVGAAVQFGIGDGFGNGDQNHGAGIMARPGFDALVGPCRRGFGRLGLVMQGPGAA